MELIDDKPNAIYPFALPEGLPARLTCVLCGGPAISEIEIDDEIVCDVCYLKDYIREHADHQHCFDTKCNHADDFTFECDGKCARCLL